MSIGMILIEFYLYYGDRFDRERMAIDISDKNIYVTK